MGTVVGSYALAKLSGGSVYGFASAVVADSRPQRSWIENGLIDAGGTHEPYIFVVRRGGQAVNSREIYERAQSEEVIRLLHSQGVEVFHTHFYKGFGMAAEMQEMQDTVRAAVLAHRYQMKVDTYIQWDTMMYETFFAEEPQAEHWIQRDAAGQPIMLTYGYQQSFRYRPCFSNQQYLDYLKKVVRFAVQEVKTDFIHFDNFDVNPEPDSCHCEQCKIGFRARLRKKYSEVQLKERLGFTNVSYVNPPLWNRFNPPEQLDIISDPVFQEWIDYRCQTMADALDQMVTEIRSLNPEIVIEINSGGISGDNSPWGGGIDQARLLKKTQVFWAESATQPKYLSDNTLISTVRTYKLARTFRNVAFTYTSESEAALGECLAFNQTIGYAGGSPLSPLMLKYIDFYRKNRDLYVGTQDVASVAVLRSYASITYNHARAGLSAILMEQALIQSNVPFHMIFDEHLESLSPSKCKVLILPNSECLSDSQIALIRRFVEAGGGLIATEQTGLYDTWRRVRLTPGLQGLVADPSPSISKNVNTGTTMRNEVGEGRVAYIPAIEFDGTMPPPEPYFTIGMSFWKRPKNWRQLIDAIAWASHGDIPLEVQGPEYLIANVVEQSDRRRRLVHLVNCDAEHVSSIAGVKVRCALDVGESVAAVRFYSPDTSGGELLKSESRDGMVSFAVPSFKVYGVVELSA
ncbi:beta-galactosidase [Terracidiphilus gabretensis]|uniref:beta-galactosidase n=1 Tax=Terracidiphilus gabretensis TaxID=1577687 RepID=UPI0018D26505|nr:beta-galactosidase [Terracidiphilus gabretensis]